MLSCLSIIVYILCPFIPYISILSGRHCTSYPLYILQHSLSCRFLRILLLFWTLESYPIHPCLPLYPTVLFYPISHHCYTPYTLLYTVSGHHRKSYRCTYPKALTSDSPANVPTSLPLTMYSIYHAGTLSRPIFAEI